MSLAEYRKEALDYGLTAETDILQYQQGEQEQETLTWLDTAASSRSREDPRA